MLPDLSGLRAARVGAPALNELLQPGQDLHTWQRSLSEIERTECNICLEPLGKNWVVPCRNGHGFHPHCVQHWVQIRPAPAPCPACMTPLEPQERWYKSPPPALDPNLSARELRAAQRQQRQQVRDAAEGAAEEAAEGAAEQPVAPPFPLAPPPAGVVDPFRWPPTTAASLTRMATTRDVVVELRGQGRWLQDPYMLVRMKREEPSMFTSEADILQFYLFGLLPARYGLSPAGHVIGGVYAVRDPYDDYALLMSDGSLNFASRLAKGLFMGLTNNPQSYELWRISMNNVKQAWARFSEVAANYMRALHELIERESPGDANLMPCWRIAMDRLLSLDPERVPPELRRYRFTTYWAHTRQFVFATDEARTLDRTPSDVDAICQRLNP
jgi:hypothetical protein